MIHREVLLTDADQSLGVALVEGDDSGRLHVSRVIENSLAHTARLEPGSILESINDVAITREEQVLYFLQQPRPLKFLFGKALLAGNNPALEHVPSFQQSKMVEAAEDYELDSESKTNISDSESCTFVADDTGIKIGLATSAADYLRIGELAGVPGPSLAERARNNCLLESILVAFVYQEDIDQLSPPCLGYSSFHISNPIVGLEPTLVIDEFVTVAAEIRSALFDWLVDYAKYNAGCSSVHITTSLFEPEQYRFLISSGMQVRGHALNLSL